MKLRVFIWILALSLAGLVPDYAKAASKTAVFLQIVDGETAFVVDPPKRKAWWVVGECRREIPIVDEKNHSKNPNQNSNINSIQSEIVSENVRIGVHRVNLRQQFRFSLGDGPSGFVRVEVYNSLRGGWADVPVKRVDNCALDMACLRRMDAPEC